MDDSPLANLRFHGAQPGCDAESEASCSAGAYVSNEEASLIKTLLQIRREADAVRSQLETASPEGRAELEARLDQLRSDWKRMSARRDRAGTRKMAMLGHIPWHEADWSD